MATIHAPTSPVARCSTCGVERQCHGLASSPTNEWDRPRDHEFVAETIDDFEPGDLTPEQLVSEIFAHSNTPRAVSCGEELRSRVRAVLGVAWDDLTEALA